MGKRRNYLGILLLLLCMLAGCAEATGKPPREAAGEMTQSAPGKTGSGKTVSDDETTTPKETATPEEPESPEFTVWDGQGELKKLDQREFGKFQYVNGTAYYGGNLPLVDRTAGEYPGKAYADAFYMTDDMIYYMQNDGTVEDIFEPQSMHLFAQPLNSKGDDVILLMENVFSAKYQDGILLCMTGNYVFKQIDAVMGELLLEFNLNEIEENGYVYTYEKDYLLYYSYERKEIFRYQYADKKEYPLYIPPKYIRDGVRVWDVWAWSGNLLSKQKYEDGTVNIVQLYEQGEPVWRIFPQKLSSCDFDFSDGKAFYYDEETGVMEYDLETNTLRTVCDVEMDEYRDGRRGYIQAESDQGGVFLIEMNSYNLSPNTFLYFIDAEGNKELLSSGFSS